VPNGTKPESHVKRFARWFDNARILEEVYFLPYADVLLRHLALQTLVLIMDGSGVGRGWAVYLSPADNCEGPLLYCLPGGNQPVISTANGFPALRSTL
jgi:hypothetical protein